MTKSANAILLLLIGTVLSLVSCHSDDRQEAEEREQNCTLSAQHRANAKTAREHADFRTAITEADSALLYAAAADDTILLTMAHNELATNFRRMGRMEKALRFHYVALDYAESYQDTCFQARKNRVVCYNGLGNAYLTLEEYAQAEHFFRLALQGEKELGSELGQAINYANLGAIYVHMGELDSAQCYYEQSMAMNEQIGSCLGIALCHVYYGQIHERRGETNEALKEYKQAIEEFCERGDLWHTVEPTIAIAELHLRQGQAQKAKASIEEVMEIAQQINSIEHMETAFTLLSSYYEQTNNPRQALQCYKQAKAYEDSVHGPKQSAELREICLNYEQKRHDRIVAQLQAADELEDAQRERILWMTLLIIVLVIIVLILLIHTNMERITLLISHLLERQRPGERSKLTEADRMWLESISQFIEEKMVNGNVTNEMIATHLSQSIPTIQNRVRILTGDTLGHYVLMTRLEYAKKQIQETQVSLSDIADSCGFYNHSYFTRIFKKYYGMMPSELRK